MHFSGTYLTEADMISLYSSSVYSRCVVFIILISINILWHDNVYFVGNLNTDWNEFVSKQITELQRIRTWNLSVAYILCAADSYDNCGKGPSLLTVPLSTTLSDIWSDQEIKAWHDYSIARRDSNQLCLVQSWVKTTRKFWPNFGLSCC